MIRKVTEHDLFMIHQTEGQLFGPHDSMEAIKSAIIDRKDSLYFMDIDGKMRGYIGLHVNAPSADIATLFTVPAYRRKGIATALLTHAMNTLKSMNIEQLILEVSTTNHVAIHMYQKLGFTPMGTRKNYYPDGSDARVLMKELT